jgi:transposase
MAGEMGISHTSVQRIWHGHGLKPHLVRSFKASKNPEFATKVADIIGLYRDPPAKALVFSVDEESQIQALDCRQPGLPMKKRRAGTTTHDYKCHGTTRLFAAPDVASDTVIGECLPCHRAAELLTFLKKIDRQTTAHLDLHLIVDNYATHKTAAVKRGLKPHPRFVAHVTPKSCSWLNLVERLLAEIARQPIRRSAFASVLELEAAIVQRIANRNQDPKPFMWTAKASKIITKQRSTRKLLTKSTAGCT